jgi:hypothetical protein
VGQRLHEENAARRSLCSTPMGGILMRCFGLSTQRPAFRS